MGNAGVIVPGFLLEPLYLSLHHRNSIQTVTANPISFLTNTLNYDFSTSSSMAFGNNMKDIDGVFVLFSGDVNQDGLIDILDIQQITDKAQQFVVGCRVEDLNGDGGIDALDMILCDNNAALKIQAVTP
jgi:hypothetical protein